VLQTKANAPLLPNARIYGWLRSSSSVASGKKETFLFLEEDQSLSTQKPLAEVPCYNLHVGQASES
jgi:hypothetical protein